MASPVRGPLGSHIAYFRQELMRPWGRRNEVDRALLNPGFVAIVLAAASRGAVREGRDGLELPLAFLATAASLSPSVRQSLPSTIRTKLSVWTSTHELAVERGRDFAAHLGPFTQVALVRGLSAGLLSLDTSTSRLTTGSLRAKAPLLGNETMSAALSKAEYCGRWFVRAGDPATVLTLWGVQP
jgi:hypothetical protein